MEYAEDGPVPDVRLVKELLREQCPHLRAQRVWPSPASGSSNWVFRVGDDHAVRLPRTDDYAADLLNEAYHLPQLAPSLPVPVPEVRFLAEPSALFPRPWSVVTWVPGDHPGELDASAQARLALGLGRFVRQLHEVDVGDQEAGPERWGYRTGEPVTDEIDGWAREAAAHLADLFDPDQVAHAWRRVRDVPPASAAPCWVHTDLSVENLLAGPDGDLAGVIDFGGLGVGDRSVDLLYAWSMLDGPARELLRCEADADEATWLRARAWAFVGPGLLSIAGYRHTMPSRTDRLVRMVESIAGEVGVALR